MKKPTSVIDSHKELLDIHSILLSLADCPPHAVSDTATVRMLKNVVHELLRLQSLKCAEWNLHAHNALREENATLRAENERMKAAIAWVESREWIGKYDTFEFAKQLRKRASPPAEPTKEKDLAMFCAE